MRRFRSAAHAPRFLAVHGLVLNLFRVGRHLLRAVHYRLLPDRLVAGLAGGDVCLLSPAKVRPSRDKPRAEVVNLTATIETSFASFVR